ncbi:hypothetical protein [Streptomyces hiroshimensis]
MGAMVMSGVLTALPGLPALRRRGAGPLGSGEIGYLHDRREVGGQVRMP